MIRASSLPVPYQTAFTNGSREAVADVPVEKGGSGVGFGPHELLEAALATCLTMTVQIEANKKGLPLTGAQCEVRIDRSVPGEVVLRYSLTLEGPLSAEQTEALKSAASRCPVGRTLTSQVSLQQVEAEHSNGSNG